MEIKETIEEIKTLTTSLRSELDKAVEKGEKDSELTVAKLEKLNDKIDKLEEQKDRLETALKQKTVSPEAKNAEVAEEKAKFDAGMEKFLRTGDKKYMEELKTELKTLIVANDVNGGYLVSADRSGRMVQQIFEISPIRQVAEVINLQNADAYEGIFDDDEADAEWVGEQSTRSDTDTADIGNYRNVAFELSATPKMSLKMMEDGFLDIAAWHEQKVTNKFARKENAAFVNGDGVSMPRGFLTYAASSDADVYERGTIGQVSSGAATTFSFDSLIELQTTLKSGYMGSFAMNRKSVRVARQLKDNDNQYLWQPSNQAGEPATLLGDALLKFEDMPDTGAGALSVAYADWRQAYQIVDRVGISVLRDPYTTKGFVKFYTRKRTGGMVVGFDAIKLLKIEA